MTTPVLEELATLAVPDLPTGTHLRVREAALHLFARKGYNATGIREIATQSGLTSSTLYHYAGTKDKLLYQILTDSHERYTLASDFLREHCDDPAELLAHLVWLHVVTHALQRESAIVGDTEIDNLGPEDRERVVAQRDHYERIWQQAIRQGVDAGSFTVRDERIVRLALLETCTSVSHWFSPRGELSAAEVAERFIDIAFAMLRHEPSSAEVPTGEDHLAGALVTRVWGISADEYSGRTDEGTDT
ncbi:Transcriptional regulator, TetR family [Leucobacter sp. 7(1)]|uniref:TetR/AcrR family transcriptional regulator n=1 Tax=Leucobacter sp. 7(1) TaxID=1255613 RepID=UPI00097F0F58|nr:TetR/AcrR family transcriptional regulator [Leucobacter sp. 7(1)]SJN11097.1 Transcriptional regulator, TetR family [Leucobacter sp. 7(1)]